MFPFWCFGRMLCFFSLGLGPGLGRRCRGSGCWGSTSVLPRWMAHERVSWVTAHCGPSVLGVRVLLGRFDERGVCEAAGSTANEPVCTFGVLLAVHRSLYKGGAAVRTGIRWASTCKASARRTAVNEPLYQQDGARLGLIQIRG